MLRSLTADYVFPVSSPPLKNGVVVVNENGVIEEVLSHQKYIAENFSDDIKHEKYTGVICPGFINAHCHLELSHLKGKLQEGRSLPVFIGEIINSREADREIIEKAIHDAEDEMIANGIVGVGDICNTADTIGCKKNNRLRYHNFIELFDIDPANCDREFEKGVALLKLFKETGQSASLIPHAPYTVSPQLLKRLYEHAYVNDSILSLHNQETESENEMFRSASGALFEKLSSFGNLYNHWKPTGFASLASTLVHLPRCNKTMLVHNTFTTAEDITWAQLYSALIYWCFCPNANMFIEKKLPDFRIFIESAGRLLIGTDSYASNKCLSVLEEIKTISKNAPKIKLEELIRWATLNGAEFFGWKKELGSLEKGKSPGLNLITDINTETLTLSEFSTVRSLLKNTS